MKSGEEKLVKIDKLKTYLEQIWVVGSYWHL
jgi:hypothetical protein